MKVPSSRAIVSLSLSLSLGLGLGLAGLTAGCVEYDPLLGDADQEVTGSLLITAFDQARDDLAAAGVALPTAVEVIDVGTCNMSEPSEPFWSDVLGGRGWRMQDPFKGVWRTYSYPKTGTLTTPGAKVKLRFNYIGLTSNTTGSSTVSRVVYTRDASGNSIEDCGTVHTMPDGTTDELLNCWAPVTSSALVSAADGGVTIEVTRGNKVSWSLPCGAITMRGTALLDRPLHVGRVDVAAFPIGIVYEPNWPTSAGGFAKGFQEVGATIGSSFTVGFQNEGQAQVFSPSASNPFKAKSVLSVLGTLVGKAPFPGSSVVGVILGGLASGLGSQSVTEFGGTTTSNAVTVQSTYSLYERMSTNLMPSVYPEGELGLGKRDIICWLRDTTLGYVWTDGYTRMVPLGFSEKRCQHAYEIRAQADLLRQRLGCKYYSIFKRPAYCTVKAGEIPGTLADLEGLLAIDPFVADPGYRPESDPGRFTDCQPMTMASYTFQWGQSNVASTTTGTSQWNSRTSQATPGFLSIIGIGPEAPYNITAKTTHSRLHQSSNGTSLGTGFQIEGNGTSVSFVRCLDAAFTSALAVPQ